MTSGWTWAGTTVFVLSLAWWFWHVEGVVRRLADRAGSTPDLVLVLLGWAPAGGGMVLAAAYLLWWWLRRRRGLAPQRVVQRVWVAVVAVWLGLTVAFTPSRALRPAEFEELVALPGPHFARAAEWSALGGFVAFALGLAAFVAVAHRLRDDEDLSDQGLAAALFPWLAGALGLPPLVVLVGLLVGTV